MADPGGDVISCETPYAIARTAFASGLHAQLRCEEADGIFGSFVSVNKRQETSEKGVLAAG